MTTKTEPFKFENANGQLLDGRLEMPMSGRIRAVALFAHCFTCGKLSRGAVRISKALAARGIATLRFDFTGLGRSEGEFADSGFASNVSDLIAASQALASSAGAPSLLVGHSLGGAAVIAAAEHIPSVRAVATIGAPFDVDHVLGQLGDQLQLVEQQGSAEVSIGGRPFVVSKEFIQEAYDQPQAERLARLGIPLLVMHAPDDDIVAVSNGEAIFAAAEYPKSFVALHRADHLLQQSEASEQAAHMIAAWAEPELGLAPEEAVPLDQGLVSVKTAGGKFTQLMRTASHEFFADEPDSFGGDDLGPTPYDLLLAGLGACTSMTIKMYADRKGIPLQEVYIELEHSREHVDDCDTCNNSDNRIDAIYRSIKLSGELSDKQRADLMRIADRCPVHRTLENRIDIHSTEERG